MDLKAKAAKTTLTLGQVITVKFPRARDLMRRRLHRAIVKGDVQFAALGAMVQWGQRVYSVEELTTPVVWLAADEQAGTAKLASKLIGRGIAAHEAALMALLADSTLVLSREYYCVLGDWHVLQNGDIRRDICTAYARLPR